MTARSAFCLSGSLLVFAAIVAPTAPGCSGAQKPDVQTVVQGVLTAAQIVCAITSQLTVPDEIAQACGVEGKLVPVLRELVGQRATVASRLSPRIGHFRPEEGARP